MAARAGPGRAARPRRGHQRHPALPAVALLAPTVKGVVGTIGRARAGTAMAAPFTAPRTSFNGTITGHRAIALAEMDLDGDQGGQGGHRHHRERRRAGGRGRRARGPTSRTATSSPTARCSRPSRSRCARSPSARTGANKVSALFTRLGTDIEDPLERLEELATTNRHAKEHHQAISADSLQDWAEFAAPAHLRPRRPGVRLAPAGREAPRGAQPGDLQRPRPARCPLYFMGARIEALHPLGPVFHGAGLNITVMSNDGRVGVGIIACRESMPDVDDLAQRFPAELRGCRRRCGTGRTSNGQSQRALRRYDATAGQRRARALTVATASSSAGTKVSDSSTQAACPVSMSWIVAPGMARARASWRAGAMTWSRRLTTTAVGTSIWGSHGREWWRPRAASAWPTAHGEVERGARPAPTPRCRGARGRGRGRRPGRRAPRSATATTVRSPSMVAPIAVKNARSASVIWNRSVVAHSTRPATWSRVLAPDPLGHDRAHRVAGDQHLLEPEHVDERAHVVGAVDQREVLALDPRPCQRWSSVTTRNRRESGSIAGNHVSSPVHPSACSSTMVGASGVGPGVSVTYVDPRPGSSTSASGGDPRVRQVDLAAQTGRVGSAWSSDLEHVTVLHVATDGFMQVDAERAGVPRRGRLGARRRPGARGGLARARRGRVARARRARGVRRGGPRPARGGGAAARDRVAGPAPAGLGDAVLRGAGGGGDRRATSSGRRSCRGVGSGDLLVTPAVREAGRALVRRPPRRTPTGRLTGRKIGVTYAAGPARLLVCADEDAPVVAVVDPGDPGVTLLESGSSARVTTHTVVLDGAGASCWVTRPRAPLTERYAAGLCLTAAGLVAGARDLTATYIKGRTQFGRSLAEFQAVAMQIADVYIASRTLDLAAANAAWRLDQGLEAGDDLAVAAYWTCTEAPRALRTCHHLHGGMGVDETYPLHHYFSCHHRHHPRSSTSAAEGVRGRGPDHQEPRAGRRQRAFKADVRAYFTGLRLPQRAPGDGPRPARRRLPAGRAPDGRDGRMGVGWPIEYGGQGLGEIEQTLFANEAQYADVHLPAVTLQTVGPTLIKYGSEKQKDLFLKRILEGDVHFAIGYSEPDAGTDLASLRTTARRDGDHYVVNGQKLWTTGGHQADYVWLAVPHRPRRAQAPRHLHPDRRHP